VTRVPLCNAMVGKGKIIMNAKEPSAQHRARPRPRPGPFQHGRKAFFFRNIEGLDPSPRTGRLENPRRLWGDLILYQVSARSRCPFFHNNDMALVRLHHHKGAHRTHSLIGGARRHARPARIQAGSEGACFATVPRNPVLPHPIGGAIVAGPSPPDRGAQKSRPRVVPKES